MRAIRATPPGVRRRPDALPAMIKEHVEPREIDGDHLGGPLVSDLAQYALNRSPRPGLVLGAAPGGDLRAVAPAQPQRASLAIGQKGSLHRRFDARALRLRFALVADGSCGHGGEYASQRDIGVSAQVVTSCLLLTGQPLLNAPLHEGG